MALYTITKNSSESEAPHIYALDDAILNQGLYAKYGCVLDGKDSLTVTKITDVLVRIGKGAFSICGYQSRIDESGYDVAIAPTQTGYFKKTLIYAQIDATTLTNPIITIEQVSTTQNGSVPADPVVPYDTPTKNDVNTSVGGVRPTKCAMLIAIVNLSGATITSITNLAKYPKNGEKVLLWTNPEPTTSRANGYEIAINTSLYSQLDILYNYRPTGGVVEIVKGVVGKNIYLMSMNGTVAQYRTLTMTDPSKIVLSDANAYNLSSDIVTTQNTYMLPQQIWGIVYGN